MIVIGIIGPKGAGKEAIAAHIARAYNGKMHSHSEILDEILHILRLPITRDNEIRLVALRKNFGPTVLTDALNKKIQTDNAAIEAITGIRYDSELDNIRAYPQNAVIFVDAPIRQRYEWQKQRDHKKDDSSMSFDEFEELEKRETEVNVAALGLKADYKIENDGTLEHLYSQVDAIIKQIKGKYAESPN